MLYITTRSKTEVYTAARTLQMDMGADGGLFVPFRMMPMENEEVLALAARKPSQNMADYLNTVFGTKLTAWDVELSLGTDYLRLRSLGHKLSVCELWHNRSGCLSAAIEALAKQIKPEGILFSKNTDWVNQSIRVAFVIGIFTELMQQGTVTQDAPANVAVASGDFSMAMAFWYGRQLGLPIADIIVGCNENSALWDLFNRGELHFDSHVIPTATPDADFAVPPALERLIYGACGHEETMNFCWSMAEKGTYFPEEEVHRAIREGFFAAVVSQTRLGIVIPSVYRSLQYVLDPYGALAYGALSDYRARTGDGAHTVLICENSPLNSAQLVCKAMQISSDELRLRVR